MMKNNPYEGLEKLFHEPKRMAIVSQLASADRGASFGELKEHCNLTDGNLSRHLRTLEEGGAVAIVKTVKKSRSLTQVHLTEAGKRGFAEYLLVLETVLHNAIEALEPEAVPAGFPFLSEEVLNHMA